VREQRVRDQHGREVGAERAARLRLRHQVGYVRAELEVSRPSAKSVLAEEQLLHQRLRVRGSRA